MHKLLQINVTSNWGSTGRIAEGCNLAAMAQGWDCYVAYSRMCNPSKSKAFRIGGKFDLVIAGVEARLFDRAGLSQRRATRKLIRQIKEIKPDIIHIHNIHGYVVNYKILFEYLNHTDIKVVWTFHDFWAFTGHCGHFVAANCERWKTECFNCPLHKGYPSSLSDFSRRNYRLKKDLFVSNQNLHIVAVSDWVGNLTRQSFLKDKDIQVIPNGVDLNVFKPTEGITHPKIKDDTFVIMAVSSQWKNNGKGLPDYKAMSKMLKDDEVIVLVGVPDEVIAGLPENIIGIRRTNNQQELAALYTRADVVTSFSSAETFGLTIVEGYACGTPAVVYDNTAPPSLITPETGFVVPDKDYNAAYEAIKKIKVNGKSSYSEACISLAREKYDKDKCYSEYVKLYEELIEKY